MGATLRAMQAAQSRGGIKGCYTVLIEGHDSVLTSGSSAETITAYSGTSWSSATAGLSWDGALKQDLAPWKAEISYGKAALFVRGPGALTVAQAVLGMASTNPLEETQLTAAVDNNDTTISVVSTANFAASGTAYLGVERFTYSGKTATTFTGCTRGVYHPLNRDGSTDNRFGRYHRIGTVGSGVTLPPKVSVQCNEWRGKWIAIYFHQRLSSTSIDTLAEAQLMFAGRIDDCYDTSDGATAIEATDCRAEFDGKVLLEEQFTAKVKEGVQLTAGMQFKANDRKFDNASAVEYAANLVVVSGAPADAYEIEEGFVLVEDLLSGINAWLTEALVVDTNLYGTHAFELIATDRGTRVALQSKFDGVATNIVCRVDITLPDAVARFLGIDGTLIQASDMGGTQFELSVGENVASNPPYRIMIGQLSDATGQDNTIHVDEYLGSFVDQETTLPEAIAPAVTTTGTWGVIDINGTRIVGKYDGSGVFSSCRLVEGLVPTGSSNSTLRETGVLYDDDGDLLVKQIVLLQDTLTDLVCALVASTGTAGYNHATHDRYDVQLGAAVPWTVIDGAFEQSLQELEALSTAPFSYVTIDKPTKLTEIIQGDLLLRLAQIVWKNGGLRVTAWQTATSLLSSHTFTGSTKASTIKHDPQRSPSRRSGEHMANVIKIEFNRKPDGTYQNTTSITDIASVTSNGAKPVTIYARNTVGGSEGVGSNVGDIVSDLLVRIPLLARELWMHRRTVNATFWEDVAPGDVCVVTDEYTWNPKTRARGLSGAPGIVFSFSRNIGAGTCEVIIGINPEDRTGTYCPCAEIDRTYTSGAFTTGYDAAGKKVRFQANRHSRSTDMIATDRQHFSVGDQVVFVEIDPSNPAAPTTVNDVIAAVGTNEVTLTTGSVTLVGTTPMRMISRYYTTAVSTQQVDTYQADDADGMIIDVAAPYLYAAAGLPPGYDTTATASNPLTDLPSRHATIAYGDGAPLDVGYEDDLIRAGNNFIHVKSALVRPWIYETVCTVGTGSSWFLVDEVPLFLGKQKLVGQNRYLKIAPFCRIDTAGSAEIRVRLTRQGAFGDSNENVTTYAPYSEVAFTVDSTTWGTEAPQLLSIDPIAYGATGECWLVVEAQETIEYRGISYLQLGVGT